MTSGNRLWGGRFTAEPAPELDRLNRSLPVDRRLWREDILGSQAWVRALVQAAVLTAEEGATLEAGLAEVAQGLERWTDGEWAEAADEDIHSLVERLLTETIGPVAGKLHTGRSRNDQVSTDARLWAEAAVRELDGWIRELEAALVDQAGRFVDALMPAHTHLQAAQPVTAGHWLLSHVWPLERDRARLVDAAGRASSLPLGSGAVSGCPFPIDRPALAQDLGFRTVSENSMDAVADRDWVAELLFCAGLIGVHLSRLAEDLIVFASEPFGFVRFSDRFSTGSSLMPQKRNPDALELARGRSGILIGDLAGFLAALKSLPSGYNKDLQEDKAALFGAFDSLGAVLPAVTGTVATMELREDRCAAAIGDALMATELADLLVERGVPFREAHDAVGRLLIDAEDRPVALDERAVEVWADLAPGLSASEVRDRLDPRRAVERRTGIGGTSPARVLDQIQALRERLDG